MKTFQETKRLFVGVRVIATLSITKIVPSSIFGSSSSSSSLEPVHTENKACSSTPSRRDWDESGSRRLPCLGRRRRRHPNLNKKRFMERRALEILQSIKLKGNDVAFVSTWRELTRRNTGVACAVRFAVCSSRFVRSPYNILDRQSPTAGAVQRACIVIVTRMCL